MRGLLGDKWFVLNKSEAFGDPKTAGNYISVSPKANRYEVERRIWYVDNALL